jgi:hypothetical protein
VFEALASLLFYVQIRQLGRAGVTIKYTVATGTNLEAYCYINPAAPAIGTNNHHSKHIAQHEKGISLLND